ncbi:hypothetical protein [Tenacibaculum ovolyticum]|uniref:hypothetical protein n=1 Tax=Tenacibaculum ovolyticum TaxID=104270 RepID=UPI0007ED8B5E|nr:hypothetical protein [Tenacibaculum ovolyticum]
MSVFTLLNKEIFGGFYSIEIIPISSILNCPLILTNSNSSDFTYIKNTANIVEILPVFETIHIKSKPKKTPAGFEYLINAGYDVTYPNKAIDNVFNELMNEKAIVKVNQHNGDAIIFGSKTSPLEITYSFQGSKKVETTHKFKVKISGKTLQKPVFL